MNHFDAPAYARLAKRLLAGEVVFFIGAGASVDSEGNSADALICRLLRRFLALTGAPLNCLPKAVQHDWQECGKRLRTAFHTTFKPVGAVTEQGGILTQKGDIDKLGKEYYAFNDWMCNAFGLLLAMLERIKSRPRLEKVERELLEYEEGLGKELPADSPAHCRPECSRRPLDLPRLMKLPAPLRGKAAFLDAMGFADPAVMAGEPYAADIPAITASYRGRLKERHHVLAWLAREGLCPDLVTTNYDLLLEGACILAGLFPHNNRPERCPAYRDLPESRFDRLRVVAGATQFFGQREAHRAARLLKIHGCVHRYRQAREAGAEEWRRALPSMVFTFREIQNWRSDTWSRDYLSSLLRSHTMVFLGYSGVDPVLHDTFRGIYEEMTARYRDHGVSQQEEQVGEASPVFFCGSATDRAFHSLEILREASRVHGAAAAIPDLDRHPNYLGIYFSSDEEQRFPTLDESLLWLFHLAVRGLQREALASDLTRLATWLLGHPPPLAEVAAVRNRFEELCRQEAQEAAEWPCTIEGRASFRQVGYWSRWFRGGLMREMALAEGTARHPAPGFQVERLRAAPWYFPSLGRGDWTAWTILLEIAVRRMIAERRGNAAQWMVTDPFVRGEEEWPPRLHFAQGSARPDPQRLVIRLVTEGRHGVETPRHGDLLWRISPGHLPWRVEGDGQGTPAAETIWEWAAAERSGNNPLEKKGRS